ncbi:adenine phosphoribosyltransferase [Apibacter raozihei]|uniref:adenine phosphoribosyltransferase n=1 Tax=Apibacter TaxID=1778601 RepID=UPI000FE3B74A|nr:MULTISPECIES: adenine phosphoribosyltransferase [Apibacter]
MKDLLKEIDNHIARVQDFPKQGIGYKDISPLFLNPELCTQVIQLFADYSRGKVDAVCGIESRGFLFGIQIARELNVPFILVRKAGKLPPPVVSQEYELEYGKAKIEIKEGYIKSGQRILVHDDVLATGGTAQACAELIEKCGGTVSQFSFLIALSFLNGKEELLKYTNDIQVILDY